MLGNLRLDWRDLRHSGQEETKEAFPFSKSHQLSTGMGAGGEQENKNKEKLLLIAKGRAHGRPASGSWPPDASVREATIPQS